MPLTAVRNPRKPAAPPHRSGAFAGTERGADTPGLGQSRALRRAVGAPAAAPGDVEQEGREFGQFPFAPLRLDELRTPRDLFARRALAILRGEGTARFDMEGAGIATRTDLAEHASLQPQRGLDDEMNHVVRQVGIETGRGIHHQDGQPVAFDPHRIAAFARPDKMDFHRIVGGLKAPP